MGKCKKEGVLTSEYEIERARVEAVIPEAKEVRRKGGRSFPKLYGQYQRNYTDEWIACKMWRGAMKGWAEAVARALYGEADPLDERRVLNMAGYGQYFTKGIDPLLLKASEARLARSQAARALKHGKRPRRQTLEAAGRAEYLIKEALAVATPRV